MIDKAKQTDKPTLNGGESTARLTNCANCGTEVLKHPDEPIEKKVYCAPCWRKVVR